MADPELQTGMTLSPELERETTLARCTWLVDFVMDDFTEPVTMGLTITPW